MIWTQQHAHRHNCIYKAAEPRSIKLFLVWVLDDDGDYDASTVIIIIGIIITHMAYNSKRTGCANYYWRAQCLLEGPILFAIGYG